MGLPAQVLVRPQRSVVVMRYGRVVVMRQDQTSEVAVPLRNGGTYFLTPTPPPLTREGGNRERST